MKTWLTCLLLLCGVFAYGQETNSVPDVASTDSSVDSKVVYVLPIRDNIDSPILYVVRRGVKEAMAADADLLIIDMDTNGGRVDVTEEIINAVNNFSDLEGKQSVTFINKKAFSAGAFIALGTEKIYMAPESFIGAAAPVMMAPTGGAQDIPGTMKAKAVSAISAMIRAQALKHGHEPKLVDAMVDESREVKIDDEVISEEGELLTLTNIEAQKLFGDPPKPLLSAGTVVDLDALIAELGFADARRVDIVPTGSEQLAAWINSIKAILLVVGIIGIYLEFKTPGFGIPGIAGIIAFVIFFMGNHVAGLSGMEWLAVFLIGVILVAIELFVIPGTMIAGLLGAGMMFVALVMAMVDYYPGSPAVPSMPDLHEPLQNLGIALIITIFVAILLARFLPKTAVYSALVSNSQSGMLSVDAAGVVQKSLVGKEGIAISMLRPSGKAQFGEEVIDVITQGEILERNQKVKVISFSGSSAVVEAIN